MGIGALVGGQIVDPADPASLTRLFTIEALTLLGLALVAAPPASRRRSPSRPPGTARARGRAGACARC
ncbi:hypothetical protein ACFQ1I_15180 [Kitasatospora arboriphila]